MTQLKTTTEEQQKHVEEILDGTCIWFSDEDGVNIDDWVSYDELAAIVDYLRSANKPKKGALDLSIVSEEMKDVVETWLAYKREKGQTYKPMGFKTFYKRLCELSGGNPHIAMQIVENSMQNNYAGIFPISNNHQAQTNGREERAKDAADLVSRLLAENNA